MREGPALRLERLALTQFRNYARLVFEPAAPVVVLTGANGSGKTNLLEAVSLLVPGRGLRQAPLSALPRQGPGATGSWAVSARLATPEGVAEIGTGSPPDAASAGSRRVFRLDGVAPRSQASVARRISAVWITPQMDRLFQEAASGRRRFLDRLVLALDPGHAHQISAFETAMASRNRLLSEGRTDAAWLAGIEDIMARHAVAVTAARLSLARRLSLALASGTAAPFPPAVLDVRGELPERLAGAPALAVEDWLRAALAASRARDAARGSASFGSHRDDMAILDAESRLEAAFASTGQQKTMLIAVVLGHAAVIAETHGAAPLLLLDEPLVHLDVAHRAALFEAVRSLPVQAFVTGTDSHMFAGLRGFAKELHVVAGRLEAAAEIDPVQAVGSVK